MEWCFAHNQDADFNSPMQNAQEPTWGINEMQPEPEPEPEPEEEIARLQREHAAEVKKLQEQLVKMNDGRCAHNGCSAELGMMDIGKGYCRHCAKKFCSTHVKKIARLPEEYCHEIYKSEMTLMTDRESHGRYFEKAKLCTTCTGILAAKGKKKPVGGAQSPQGPTTS